MGKDEKRAGRESVWRQFRRRDSPSIDAARALQAQSGGAKRREWLRQLPEDELWALLDEVLDHTGARVIDVQAHDGTTRLWLKGRLRVDRPGALRGELEARLDRPKS